jgi:hypothetical protein
MEPLDLTRTPPRGPREKLLGLCFLPRTIDKIRGELPGGNAGAYFVDNPIGMSAYVLKKIGVGPAALRDVVANAHDERDVAAWLEAHADLSHVDELNASISNVTVGMMPPDRRAAFNAFYPGAEAFPDDLRVFDVIEMDDAQLIK